MDDILLGGLKQHFIDFPGIFSVFYVVVHVLGNSSFNLDVLVVNGKGKVYPRKCHEGLGAGGGGRWSTPRPGRFTPWKETLYSFIGDWVEPRAV
jgi:hypothetical protein